MSEWQLIETAPKDGPPVLLGANDWPLPFVGWWINDKARWAAAGIFNGRYAGHCGGRSAISAIPQPTHWMPLPAPPAILGETAGKQEK